MKFFIFAAVLLFHNFVTYSASAEANAYEQWLADLKADAIKQGISAQVVEAAFVGVVPIERVVELDRKQPEHKATLEEYLDKTVVPYRIENGKRELLENRELLDKVAMEYSVPPEVVVALWGMETSYGENTGNFNIISALTTLAYDGRRSAFFRKELINSLKILQDENMNPENFTGSWAGAFGQCQFMPSSYLSYAVDFDKDGKRDIWFTNADIFASIAHYLSKEGWDKDGDITEGSNNFKVLLKWNRSRYFATAVGKLVQKFGE